MHPADNEDLALTLNGKKRHIRKSDFTTAFATLKLDEKQQENIFRKMEKSRVSWIEQIEASFLSEDFKLTYKALITERSSRL